MKIRMTEKGYSTPAIMHQVTRREKGIKVLLGDEYKGRNAVFKAGMVGTNWMVGAFSTEK